MVSASLHYHLHVVFRIFNFNQEHKKMTIKNFVYTLCAYTKLFIVHLVVKQRRNFNTHSLTNKTSSLSRKSGLLINQWERERERWEKAARKTNYRNCVPIKCTIPKGDSIINFKPLEVKLPLSLSQSATPRAKPWLIIPSKYTIPQRFHSIQSCTAYILRNIAYIPLLSASSRKVLENRRNYNTSLPSAFDISRASPIPI